jgi:hypothetical protein
MTVTISGTNGVTFPDSSLQAAAASPYVLKNRIINGDMRIAQRGTGAVTADGFPVDRFIVVNSTDGAFSAQQDSSAPAGFTNSLKFTTTTVDSSLASTQSIYVQQRIEGNNVADLGFGTANAKTITVSFWVRSSLTGNFGGAIINNAFNRSYPFSYTISAADTWEYKTITISGDTTGTWLTDAGRGLILNFSLGAGTDRVGTAGSWVGANNQGVTGQTQVIGTLNATWYITGVQLEVGTSATPFERRLYNQELANCQRYFQHIGKVGGEAQVGGFRMSTQTQWAVNYYNTMRSAPTITLNGLLAHDLNDGDNLTLSSLSLVINAGTNSSWLAATNSGTGTVNGVAIVYPTGTPSGLYLSAEL